LTFAYRESDVELVGVERVAMITPAIPSPEAEQAGYFAEVRDASGDLLHSRPLHDPLRHTIEVFEEDGSIHRVENPKREGEFQVLVPDLPAAEEFSLHGPPPGKPEWHGRTEALLRHDFAELRKRGDRRQQGEEEEGS
jgi:hypothetical protein